MITRRQWLTASLGFVPTVSLTGRRKLHAQPDEDQHPLNPANTFDSFRVTDDSAAAFRACRELATGSSRSSSLIYVWGPPGAGKTHLLQATAHALRQPYGGRPVWYGQANDFKRLLIRAVHSGAFGPFRERFRAYDALLLDDIQLLRHMARTTEELVDMLDWIRDGGGSILLTGDAGPEEVTLCARFADRLRRGRVVRVARRIRGGSE